ncbi:MAG: hypothetical protein ABEK03_07955 [Candidatus Bipolaricaulia bacterium]
MRYRQRAVEIVIVVDINEEHSASDSPGVSKVVSGHGNRTRLRIGVVRGKDYRFLIDVVERIVLDSRGAHVLKLHRDTDATECVSVFTIRAPDRRTIRRVGARPDAKRLVGRTLRRKAISLGGQLRLQIDREIILSGRVASLRNDAVVPKRGRSAVDIHHGTGTAQVTAQFEVLNGRSAFVDRERGARSPIDHCTGWVSAPIICYDRQVDVSLIDVDRLIVGSSTDLDSVRVASLSSIDRLLDGRILRGRCALVHRAKVVIHHSIGRLSLSGHEATSKEKPQD